MRNRKLVKSVIAAWTHTGVTVAIDQVIQTLTAAEAASITDFTNLRLRMERTT